MYQGLTISNGVLIRESTGKPCKTFSNGKYLRINHKGRMYYLHRVLWELTHGSIPKGYTIDHIDGNPTNNNIDNLRLASYSENNMNRVSTVDNGLPQGIYWCNSKSRYVAQVVAQGVKRTKTSKSLDVVTEWVKETRKEIHKEFAIKC
ncbi:HNH endonuclease [Escherichia phage vB_Ec_Tarrare]|uniref:HNH endonuclease n=1 Tax=Escherichia phage vB_Ec_Tarrare TaxID=3032379 RepID=A0AAF0ICR8_9CAUD|nr:HNH endonuclease [Escherichia phage vB_Ec_Tarrare]